MKGVPDKLWRVFLLLIVILLFGAYFEVKEWCLVLIAVFLCLILVLAVGAYLFFMFKNPVYLRSESFQIRKQAIEILGDKDGLLPTDIARVINVQSPTANMLTFQEGDEQNEE